MAENYTLTVFLWKSTKHVAQSSTFFFILLLIAGGFLINQGEPDTQYMYLNPGETKTITVNANNYFQFIVFYQPVGDEEYNDAPLRVRISSKEDGSVIFDEWNEIALGRSFKSLSGEYTMQVTNLDTVPHGYRIVTSSFDIRGVVAFSIIFVIFMLNFTALMTLGPVLIAVLIINSLTGRKGSSAEKVVSPPVVVRSNPTSYRHDMGLREWLLLAIAFIFVLMISFDEAFFVFSVLIAAFVISTVLKRNRIRNRTAAILNIKDSVHISELMITVGEKSQKTVEDMLSTMILEQGYPIRYDRQTGYVTRVGDLSPFLNTLIVSTSDVVTRVRGQQDGTETARTGPGRTETARTGTEGMEQRNMERKETVTVPRKKEVSAGEGFHCVSCGQNLPSGTKYCYSCGSKQ